MNKPIRSYWETFEDLYQMGPQKHRLYMLDLLQEKGVKSLLDIGCGTAPIFELLWNGGARWNSIKDYKGVDYSWKMIEICRREFPQGDFEVQDMRSLKEPDNSRDCVLLLHSLDHTNNYQAAIWEAARVAKRYVCIVLWRSFVEEGTNLNDRNMYGKQEGEQPWEDTYLQEYSKKVLEDEFEKNGLVIEETAEGEKLNEENKYNFLFMLKKI